MAHSVCRPHGRWQWKDATQVIAVQAASKGSESRRALLRAMWQLHWREYTAIGCIKLVGDALNFAGPFLLQLLLRCVMLRSKAGASTGVHYVNVCVGNA